MAATALLVLATVAPASGHPGHGRDALELQHDGGNPGDASNLCRDPFPTLDRDAVTTGRLRPLPPVLPVSDAADHYALPLEAGAKVTISTGWTAPTLVPVDPASGPAAGPVQDSSSPVEDQTHPPRLFHLQVWEPGCGQALGHDEPAPRLGEKVTFTAPVKGVYTVEVFHPPVDPEVGRVPGPAPGPGIPQPSADAPLDKRCHPHCRALQTANLLAGYDLLFS